MRVVTLKEIPEIDLGEAVPIDGWPGGGVRRTRQTIIEPGESENYNCSVSISPKDRRPAGILMMAIKS